jgi:hypothetical protein
MNRTHTLRRDNCCTGDKGKGRGDAHVKWWSEQKNGVSGKELENDSGNVSFEGALKDFTATATADEDLPI